jgi:hypothetical protein
MKGILSIAMVLALTACNPLRREQTPVPGAPPLPEVQKVTEHVGVLEEDCDQKAKKPIEIKEDSISLSGDAGCSLEE